MQFARKQRRTPVINIISLIDILVVLLIFYIATTVFKKSEPKLNIVVPESTHAKPTQDKLPSTIYVTSASKVFLDDVPVEPEKLGDLLKAKLEADPGYKVALRADKDAPFGIITKVMEAANAAHISSLPTVLQAQPAGGATAP